VLKQVRDVLARVEDHEIMPTHSVIWIDHKEARIFHVHPEATDETTVLAPQHHLHRHPKGRGKAREHPDEAHRFFGEVARTLDGVDAILIVGPSSAKLEFFRYVHAHKPRLELKVVGIESLALQRVESAELGQLPGADSAAHGQGGGAGVNGANDPEHRG
jgi:stalled ribosome rescue protein Dom34